VFPKNANQKVTTLSIVVNDVVETSRHGVCRNLKAQTHWQGKNVKTRYVFPHVDYNKQKMLLIKHSGFRWVDKCEVSRQKRFF
jgi:hypothetical protein